MSLSVYHSVDPDVSLPLGHVRSADDQQQRDRQKAADEAQKQKEIDNANGALASKRAVADKYSVSEDADAGKKAEKEAAVSVDPSVRLLLPLLPPHALFYCAL